MLATMSGSRPGTLFDIGDIIDRTVETGMSTFEEIAPIWAANQLGVDYMPPGQHNPTFQSGADEPVPKDSDLTTQPTEPETVNNLNRPNQQQILMIGGGLVLLLILMNSS